MRSFCRTRTTGCVGTWRSDQTSAFAYQIKCNRVIRHPYSDSIHSSGCCHRNGIAFPDDHRQGTRPESIRDLPCLFRYLLCNLVNVLKPINMNDQWVVGRSALCRIYFLGRRRIQCISPQPVHGLGRESHQSSLLQDCSRRPEFLLIFFADGALSGTNLYDLSLHVFTFCVLNCIWI